MSEPRVMTDPVDVSRYLLAGHATLTLKSLKSGEHLTYKVTLAPEKTDFYFVGLLIGSDQEYAYMGVLTNPAHGAPVFRLTGKSKYNEQSRPVLAFRFFLNHLVHPSMEVRHEGSCGRCGRQLTHPESIDRGIGPECWGKMGFHATDRASKARIARHERRQAEGAAILAPFFNDPVPEF